MLKLYFVVELAFDPNNPRIVSGPYFTYNDAAYSSFMNEAKRNAEEYKYDIRHATIMHVDWGF